MIDEAKPAADLKGHEKAEARKSEGHQTALEKSAEAEAAAAHETRAKRLIDGYAHALHHGSPRTDAELAEIKALLLGDDHHEGEPADKTG